MSLHTEFRIGDSTSQTYKDRVKKCTKNTQWNKYEESKKKVFHHKTTRKKPSVDFFSIFTIYLSTLFLLTIFAKDAASQIHEIEFKLDETNFNETNEDTTMSWLQIMDDDVKIHNLSDETNISEETTHSWQEFMDLDANDSIQNNFYKNADAEETTMSWMQMMDLDLNEPDETVNIQRLRRDVQDSGSGSGSGSTTEESTTETISTTFVETTTASEGSGVTNVSSTTELVTGTPETTDTVSTEENTEDLTSSFTSTVFDETTTYSEGSGITEVATTSETTEIVSTEESTVYYSSASTFEATTQETTSVTDESSGDDETTTQSETTNSAGTVTESEDTLSTTVEMSATDTPAVSTTATTSETTYAASTSTEMTTEESTPVVVTTPEKLETTITTEVTTTEATTEDFCSDQTNDCPNNQFCAETALGKRCKCVPGTTLTGGTCVSAKQFGGKLHIDIDFIPSLNDPNSDDYLQQEQVYINLLIVIYGQEPWYKSVIIIGFSSGSTVVNYELVTTDDDDVDSTTIERSFSSFLTNPQYFPSNCSCEDDSCNPDSTNLGFSSPILANSSCNDAGTATEIICDDPETSQYCHVASTTCGATLNGNVICQCNSGYVDNPDSANSCIQTICTKNSDCNSPFGDCQNTTENAAGRCNCMWGFSGNNCDEPWLFVFVVVLSGIVFIGLVVVAVCVVKKKYRSSKWKKSSLYYENVIRNNDAKKQEGKNIYEWGDKPGVVPTGYKTIGDTEPYGSISWSNDHAISQSKDNNNQEVLLNPYGDAFRLQERGKQHGNSGTNGIQNEEDLSWRVREGNNGAGFSENDIPNYVHHETVL